MFVNTILDIIWVSINIVPIDIEIFQNSYWKKYDHRLLVFSYYLTQTYLLKKKSL